MRSAGPLHVGPADHRDGPVRFARAGVLSSSASSCKRTVSRYAHDCEVKRLAIRLNLMCIIITGEIEWMIKVRGQCSVRLFQEEGRRKKKEPSREMGLSDSLP